MKILPSRTTRRHLAAVLATAMLALSPAGFAQKKTVAASAQNRSPIAVIAHRGGALLRPENTMPAFQNTAKLGADYLEFDMEMTADDRIVIYHDATINPDFCRSDTGVAAAPEPVRSLSAAAIRKLDCGSGVRPQYAGERYVAVPGARVPELDEVLGAFKDGDALFFAETKIPKESDVDPVKFATLFEAAVRAHGLENRLILQSFDFRTIDAMHSINPRIRTCLLGVPRLTKDYLTKLREHHATCIVLSHDEVDRTEVEQLRKAGILVFSGVSDEPDAWRQYVDLGVDAIFTNDPEGVIHFLQGAGIRD